MPDLQPPRLAKPKSKVKKTFRWKNIAIYSAIGCGVTLGSVLAVSSYLLVNLNKYIPWIQNQVQQKTGYSFHIDNLASGFNNHGQPYISITGLRIFAPQRITPFIKLNQLNLSLAYTSLWHLQLIFAELELDGSNLWFEYNKNNSLLLNGVEITKLDDKPTKSNFDIQPWLWAQQNISLKNLNLVMIDSKHNIQPLVVNNIEIAIKNLNSKHSVYTQADLAHSKLQASLSFDGDGLNSFKNVGNGDLQLNTIGDQGYIVNLFAKVNHGVLQSVQTNFDSNNQQQIQRYMGNYNNFSDFHGNIAIDRDESNNYSVFAHDLSLNTDYGYLFKHAEINGIITTHSGGWLAINNLQLAGINSLIKFSQFSDKLELAGNLNTIHIDWQGNLTSPVTPQLTTTFNNLTLNSNESNIPSLNNLNGQIYINESSGKLDLQMQNGIIKYPNFYYLPLHINSFMTNLAWQIESQNNFRAIWKNTSLVMPELNLVSEGIFDAEKHSLICTSTLSIPHLENLYKIMPTTTPKDGVKYLQQSLQAGGINNIKITINGDPREFPFNNGGGKFDILGQIHQVNLKYLPQLPPLTNINGQLIGHNQTVQAKLSSASLGDAHLENAQIILPDINAQSYTIGINAKFSGQSLDFINYLESSPYQEQITKLNNLVDLTGAGIASLNIKLPLDNPAKLKLNGSYQVIDNQIILKDTPQITISNINGKVNFNQTGLTNSTINATSLNSPLELSIVNSHELAINSSNLDFTKLLSTFYPPLTQIINGTAITSATYDINQQQLNISSNLESVIIDAPAPLAKPRNIAQQLNIGVNFSESAPIINVNYANMLYAHASLTVNNLLNRLQVGLGTNQLALDNSESAPITLNIFLDNTYTTEWAQFVSHVLDNINKYSATESSPTPSSIMVERSESSPDGLYPIKVAIKTNAFWVNNYNLDHGYAKCQINHNSIQAYINTPDIRGTADYQIESNSLVLSLNNLAYANSSFYATTSPPYSESITNNSVSTIAESDNYSMFESSNRFESVNAQNPESAVNQMESNLSTNKSSDSVTSLNDSNDYPHLPQTKFTIENLYYQNHFLGSLTGTIYQQDSSLFFENLVLNNKAATTKINIMDYCVACNKKTSYVAINVHSDVNNLGLLANKIDLGNNFKNGSGTIDLSAKWPGNLDDFNLNKLLMSINVNVVNGELTQINPGLFGALMGVINLSAINNITNPHFNFNSLFGKGFAYQNLTSSAIFKNDNLQIENLELAGEVANVSSFGNYSLTTNSIDSYLTVTPRLGGTVATTAGIVTLNPFIGMFVYLGERLFGDPINKALAISYHVTGDVESPVFTQTKVSKQLMSNFKSSLDFLPLPNQKPGNN